MSCHKRALELYTIHSRQTSARATSARYGQRSWLVRRGAVANAFSATILIRLCTLWFAVAVGIVATLVFYRHYGTVEPNEES